MNNSQTKWDLHLLRAFEDISEGMSIHSASVKWRLYEPKVRAEYPEWVKRGEDTYAI